MEFQGMAIRWSLLEGELWWVAVDVCATLGVENARDAVRRLDDDEKMTVGLTDSHSDRRGGAPSMRVINESGLYSLELTSRKPEAKEFKRWVTHVVLPSIRKTGGYHVQARGFRELAREALAQADLELRGLENLVAGQARRVAVYDRLVAGRAVFDFGVCVRLLGVGGLDRSGLFGLLRDEGVLAKDWDGRDRITPAFSGDGRFTYEQTKFWKYGVFVTYDKPVATLKGLEFLFDLVDRRSLSGRRCLPQAVAAASLLSETSIPTSLARSTLPG